MTLHVYKDLEQRSDSHEEWRHIPGFDDRYEVSDLGRVRSYCKHGHRARIGTPHLMTVRPNLHGYLAVGLQVSGKRRPFTVHMLVARAFLGPRPVGYQVAHADGDRTNARVNNLRYATPAENNRDKERHGTVMRGESAGRAKLTDSQIMDIRSRYQMGELQVTLAALFGISQSQVSNIVRRANWSHITSASEAA